jgi:hypothetical protein
MTQEPLTITLPAETLEVIAARVAELVRGQTSDATSPWMTRAQAAEYLHVPISRLEKDRQIPFHKWESRVLYHRAELDEAVRSMDNTRP